MICDKFNEIFVEKMAVVGTRLIDKVLAQKVLTDFYKFYMLLDSANNYYKLEKFNTIKNEHNTSVQGVIFQVNISMDNPTFFNEGDTMTYFLIN